MPERPPPLDDYPLRAREPAVFGGSPRRSRLLWTAVLVVALALAAWGSMLVLGLEPMHASGLTTVLGGHDRPAGLHEIARGAHDHAPHGLAA